MLRQAQQSLNLNLSYLRSPPCSHMYALMRHTHAFICVLSCICSHTGALTFVHSHVWHLRALAHLCSYMCVVIRALSPVCFHMCSPISGCFRSQSTQWLILWLTNQSSPIDETNQHWGDNALKFSIAKAFDEPNLEIGCIIGGNLTANSTSHAATTTQHGNLLFPQC